MRIIDLHCYPGTQEWIDCQGPYVDALAKYWNRSWVGKTEDEVLRDFTDAGVEACLVALDLASGKSLYSVVANGEARLLATDYEDARPFYPRISPGRTSAFIYPDGASFPPGQVGAVALEQAVNGLIYELEKVAGS